MDNRDVISQAEKYKREMMKLYSKRSAPFEKVMVRGTTPQEVVPAANISPRIEEPSEEPQDEERIITTEPKVVEDSEPIEESIDEKYPEPDLSEIEVMAVMAEPEEDDTETAMAKGMILVNVRAGENYQPIEKAEIVITSIVDGNRSFITSGVTNESGVSPQFEVTVPSSSYSMTPDSEVRPYSLFDISVTADGFFNSRSVDVPVFEGITSVQNFNMIPVPLYMKPNEETVTIYNQEPNL